MSGGGKEIHLTGPQRSELVKRFAFYLSGFSLFGDMWRGRRVIIRNLYKKGLLSHEGRATDITAKGRVVAASIVGGSTYKHCDDWQRKHRRRSNH